MKILTKMLVKTLFIVRSRILALSDLRKNKGGTTGKLVLSWAAFLYCEEEIMITKPKGCHDIYGMEAKKWKYISNLIDAVCERYNYEFIRTPIFEASELYHRGVGETSDIVTKETYDFIDRGERKMTLRPEGTAGIVRSYIENKMYGDAKQPIKLYYNGTMYRYERPQSGRDRELTQFGVEVLGSDDPMIDAEVISIAVNIYKMVGLKGIKVNINSLGDKEYRDNYLVNSNVVRGLDYYDHTVFEVESMVEGFGIQNVLGGGGRYNGLVKELDGPEVPGMGFAMGLGRLMLAIEKENIELPIDNALDAFVMYVSDTEKDYATTLVQELRMNGFKIDTEYTGRGLKAQFKQADRLNSKFLIILNDEDLKNNEIKIKNNKTKDETTVELDYLMYYLDEALSVDDDCDCGCSDDDHECDCGHDCHCHDDIEF